MYDDDEDGSSNYADIFRTVRDAEESRLAEIAEIRRQIDRLDNRNRIEYMKGTPPDDDGKRRGVHGLDDFNDPMDMFFTPPAVSRGHRLKDGVPVYYYPNFETYAVFLLVLFVVAFYLGGKVGYARGMRQNAILHQLINGNNDGSFRQQDSVRIA